MAEVVYCLDTSALLEGWERYYPPDTFPGVWTKFDELIEKKRLIGPREVLEEAGRKGSEKLKAWLKEREEAFPEADEGEQQIMRQVLAKFPLLVKEIKRRTAADGYVIAMAVKRELTVVSMERIRNNSAERPRIPDVLNDEEFKRPHIKMLEMMQAEAWKFG